MIFVALFGEETQTLMTRCLIPVRRPAVLSPLPQDPDSCQESPITSLSSLNASLDHLTSSHSLPPSAHSYYLTDGLSSQTSAKGGDPCGMEDGTDADVGENVCTKHYGGGLTLDSLVKAGAGALRAKTRQQADEGMKMSPLFQQYVDAVKGKGYFDGAGEEGGEVWEERMEKIRVKFRRKLWEKEAKGKAQGSDSKDAGASNPSPTAAAAPKTAVVVPPATPEANNAANALKDKGNAQLKSKNYKEAIKCYTEALKLCPNGDSSHIYYSNRAAAYCHMGSYDRGEMDAERSVNLDSSYAKGWVRLGLCRFELEDYEGSKEAYERALEEDKDLKGPREQISRIDKIVKAKKRGPSYNGSSSSASSSSDDGGMPDMSSLAAALAGGDDASSASNSAAMSQAASMLGGDGSGAPPGLAGLLNNPAMMQMAQQVMSNPQAMQQSLKMMQNNPQMAAMASQMFSNPDAMNDMMGAMMGGKKGGGKR